MRKLTIFFLFSLLFNPAYAVWVDFLDPEEIAKEGRWIGQVSECQEARRGGYDRMIQRIQERLRAASSDQTGNGWKIDESVYRKAWAIFQKGLNYGKDEARQMSRSKRAYENRLCAGMYRDIYEFATEKSVPESAMDGSLFK